MAPPPPQPSLATPLQNPVDTESTSARARPPPSNAFHLRSVTPAAPPRIKPVLASTLLSNLLGQQNQAQRRDRGDHAKADRYGEGARSLDPLRSGLDQLDDYVLLGGVGRGTVVGISGDVDGTGGGAVGRIVALHFLSTALLSNPFAKASIIDTTGSFSVSLLAKIIRLRVRSTVEHGVGIQKTLDERVQEILARVAISRAFDIEGVWEVLSEISADHQSLITEQTLGNLDEKVVEDLGPITLVDECAGHEPLKQEMEPEIIDSEAEDEDEDCRSVNLSQMGNMKTPTAISTSLPGGNPALIMNPPVATRNTKSTGRTGRTEIVIIDSMTLPISEIFSHREKNSAHTLLSTFSRTLYSLSQTNNIVTFLLNTINSAPARGVSRFPSKPVSVFAATTARPSLGRLFSDLCALHLFITWVPKTAKDTELLYAAPIDPDSDVEEPRPPTGDPRPPQRQEDPVGVEHAFVIEVLKDTTQDLGPWLELGPALPHRGLLQNPLSGAGRLSLPAARKRKREPGTRNRLQRWAPFVVSPDGMALLNAFNVARPQALSMPTLAPVHLAKQFPFGRRA